MALLNVGWRNPVSLGDQHGAGPLFRLRLLKRRGEVGGFDNPQLAGLPGNPQSTWKRRALTTLAERTLAAVRPGS